MNEMVRELERIRSDFASGLSVAVKSEDLENLRIGYLGKKGRLTGVLRGMGSLSSEERPAYGLLANQLREEMENTWTAAAKAMADRDLEIRLAAQSIDVTLPGRPTPTGARHPLGKAADEICDIFLGLGFEIAEGPEIELDWYNFGALNIPQGHPSRDTQDTFYITDDILLRTQTSPVQIRVLEKKKPPVRIVCPGKVYRSDALDSTHSPIFHQVEGLVVDRGVTMGDLVGCLRLFAKRLFGEATDIRLRPHHFPFTEPSCEVDVTCWTCGGTGCRTCKGEGWIELLGAGMVHPDVLRTCGVDPAVYSGFAFGIGIDRTAMARYGIDDVRNLFENDIRFLRQFR